MKPFDSEELKDKWKGVKLSERTRARMENTLKEYAQFHAVNEGVSGTVRVEEESRSIKRIPRSGILSFIQPSNWNFKPMTALILIALLAGGSTSFAAERAVPGDALYGVKVEVNEEIKSMFALSNKSEAALQARLMEERLEEAETLASRGELTSEVAIELGIRMKAHMSESAERSEASEAEGDFETAAKVRASVDASLRSYTTILASLSGNSSNTGVGNLLTDMSAMTTANSNVDTSTSFGASANADVREEVQSTLRTATDIVEKAQAEFESATKLSASAKATIEARLDKAIEASVEAEASFRAEAYDAAYSAARTAMSIAHEVRTMIGSALRIDLNLDTTVDSVLDINLDSSDTGEQTEDGGSVEIEANTDTDASVDSNFIDTNLNTNTTVSGSAVNGTLGF